MLRLTWNSQELKNVWNCYWYSKQTYSWCSAVAKIKDKLFHMGLTCGMESFSFFFIFFNFFFFKGISSYSTVCFKLYYINAHSSCLFLASHFLKNFRMYIWFTKVTIKSLSDCARKRQRVAFVLIFTREHICKQRRRRHSGRNITVNCFSKEKNRDSATQHGFERARLSDLTGKDCFVMKLFQQTTEQNSTEQTISNLFNTFAGVCRCVIKDKHRPSRARLMRTTQHLLSQFVTYPWWI